MVPDYLMIGTLYDEFKEKRNERREALRETRRGITVIRRADAFNSGKSKHSSFRVTGPDITHPAKRSLTFSLY